MTAGCGRGLATSSTYDAADRPCLACHGTAQPPPVDTRERVVADIVDTHFDDWRFAEDGSFLTTPTAALEGYVLDEPAAWAPEGVGYVSFGGDDPCGGSCHDGHEEPVDVGRQWARSGHGDASSAAWQHEFTNGACLQCHSGVGYAAYVALTNLDYPQWIDAPTEELFGHPVTCNGCHDAQAVPSAEDPRLRKSGAIALVSGAASANAVVDAVLDAGASATCITCHQGRESGSSLYAAMLEAGVDPTDAVDETLADQSFINPHYRAAGAMLYSLKGFEYPGKRYSPGNLFHQGSGCTGCHMSASDDPDLGGHSFAMHAAGRDHVESCRACHGPVESFEVIGLLRDFDGDGVAHQAGSELERLKGHLVDALAAEGVYYVPDTHPYFFTTADAPTRADRVRQWQESQLTAAFNLGFVGAEPGAYAHNPIYAAQLLWDAYEAVAGVPLPAQRPSSPNDRPAVEYLP